MIVSTHATAVPAKELNVRDHRPPESALSNLLHENRRFAPPAELAANANAKADLYERGGRGPAGVLGEAGGTG